LPPDYSFQPADAGRITFVRAATLITPGDQVLTITETVSGVTGSVVVAVVPGPRPPPGGGGRRPAVPSSNANDPRTQHVQAVNRLFASWRQGQAGLLMGKHKHEGTGEDLFAYADIG
jgi:hypothetical protein